MIIGVDFDGTVVKHAYPEIGEPLLGAVGTLKALVAEGHRLILWTMRSGETLDAAVSYMENNGVVLWGVNCNPEQNWSSSPKAYCHIYIDDAALGCPLVQDEPRAKVDWSGVVRLLERAGALREKAHE
jgi:hypothetical protein